jgi:hypothetical protein
VGGAAEDDLLNDAPHLPAHGLKAVVPLGGEFVVFADAAFKDADAAVQEFRLLHGVEQGVETSRADVITEAGQIFAQPAPIEGGHTGLVEDKEFHHALPEGLGDLLLIEHISGYDICRLENNKNSVAFRLFDD